MAPDLPGAHNNNNNNKREGVVRSIYVLLYEIILKKILNCDVSSNLL